MTCKVASDTYRKWKSDMTKKPSPVVKGVSKERTGWRDQYISELHRTWGVGCSCVDIDFLMIEYNYGIPKGLVEYKHENAPPINYNHPSIRAYKYMANCTLIPFFTCRYAGDGSWFFVTPVNDFARELLPKPRKLTQYEWVELLYLCRGSKIPTDIEQSLRNI